tara:strand:+ start:227 stop:340 length:114 start_codon:yes stop_codon:yes gene_type:complete
MLSLGLSAAYNLKATPTPLYSITSYFLSAVDNGLGSK